VLSALRYIIGSDVTLRHAGWLCVISALLLSLLGIYAIDLASNTDLSVAGDSRAITLSGLVLKQIIFLAVGLAAGAIVAFPHYKYARLLAWPVLGVVLLLLLVLVIPGVPASLVTPRNGARAWIDLGPIDLQPAELAKIAFVLVIADYLRNRETHRKFLGLVPPAMITFIPVALIMLQPDLGTAMLFMPALLAMLLAAGAKLSHLGVVVVMAALALPASYPLLRPHQKQRIVGLIHMVQGSRQGADDINFQSLTAQTLAGAGQDSGVSDRHTRALVRFNRLPERHNDMIFAVITLRFGMLGALGVLGLYAMYFLGAIITAALCKDAFGRLVVIGSTTIIAAQMFVNVGMTTGFLPIIGLTLPFVSYGGSSMLSVWLMTGLIVSVSARRPRRLVRPAFEFGRRVPEWDGMPATPVISHRVPPASVTRRA
jgi:rod shape determining protein RodA